MADYVRHTILGIRSRRRLLALRVLAATGAIAATLAIGVTPSLAANTPSPSAANPAAATTSTQSTAATPLADSCSTTTTPGTLGVAVSPNNVPVCGSGCGGGGGGSYPGLVTVSWGGPLGAVPYVWLNLTNTEQQALETGGEWAYGALLCGPAGAATSGIGGLVCFAGVAFGYEFLLDNGTCPSGYYFRFGVMPWNYQDDACLSG